ncbi:MAG: isoprenylcysteine carboxylmethyltransferase family protein [Chloroflexota bacterium]
MPYDDSTQVHQGAAVQVQAVRRVLALPSREGLLVCAASLMPAYLFGLMGLMNVLGLINMAQAGPSVDPRGAASGWLHLGHQALTTAFSVLVCWLFLIRRPSAQSRGAGGRISDIAAVAGTVVAIGISIAPRTVDNIVALAAAEALLTMGLVIMMIGLTSLGRSFGIMPRARGLVQSGMYQWVRHPIYLGEFLAFGGLLVLTISPVTATIYAVFVALQLYRLVAEEQTLRAAYPEYDAYCARTARLLPGVY